MYRCGVESNMFERFRKKKQPEGQVIEPDVIPKHIMPNREHIIALGYSESLPYFKGFLEGLTRTQLMDFQDSKQFDDTAVEEAAWECANNEEWKRDWPMGKEEYQERIPSIVLDAIPIRYNRPKDKNDRPIDLDLNKLVNQIEGIQKKLDRLMKLVENTEVTMSGKTAINL